MAKKLFKKGQSGNPGGRPKVPEDVKRLRALTSDQLKQLGDLIILGTRQDLKALLENPKTNALQAWIASVAVKGINKGDMSSLNELLNRLIGKVTDKVEVKLPVPTIIKRTDGSEIVLGAKMREESDHE